MCHQVIQLDGRVGIAHLTSAVELHEDLAFQIPKRLPLLFSSEGLLTTLEMRFNGRWDSECIVVSFQQPFFPSCDAQQCFRSAMALGQAFATGQHPFRIRIERLVVQDLYVVERAGQTCIDGLRRTASYSRCLMVVN